jgi:hypothetical protein
MIDPNLMACQSMQTLKRRKELPSINMETRHATIAIEKKGDKGRRTSQDLKTFVKFPQRNTSLQRVSDRSVQAPIPW